MIESYPLLPPCPLQLLSSPQGHVTAAAPQPECRNILSSSHNIVVDTLYMATSGLSLMHTLLVSQLLSASQAYCCGLVSTCLDCKFVFSVKISSKWIVTEFWGQPIHKHWTCLLPWPDLQGVTFLALGNGAPDIFSAFAAVNQQDDRKASLAVGALFGESVYKVYTQE